jgi:hypothetical protein
MTLFPLTLLSVVNKVNRALAALAQLPLWDNHLFCPKHRIALLPPSRNEQKNERKKENALGFPAH